MPRSSFHRARPRTLGLSIAAAATAALCGLCGGCAITGTPNYDRVFGDGTRALTAQQIYDPQAPLRHAGVVPATDGRTMREALDRQVGSFKEPPATSVINIGVGGR